MRFVFVIIFLISCLLHSTIVPESSSTIISTYGPRLVDLGSGLRYDWHGGYDFSASIGDSVKAVTTGIAELDSASGAGLYIKVVNNIDFVHSGYHHLSSRLVADGDSVYAGDIIALSGNTGAGGSHLDLKYYEGTNYRGLSCVIHPRELILDPSWTSPCDSTTLHYLYNSGNSIEPLTDSVTVDVYTDQYDLNFNFLRLCDYTIGYCPRDCVVHWFSGYIDVDFGKNNVELIGYKHTMSGGLVEGVCQNIQFSQSVHEDSTPWRKETMYSTLDVHPCIPNDIKIGLRPDDFDYSGNDDNHISALVDLHLVNSLCSTTPCYQSMAGENNNAYAYQDTVPAVQSIQGWPGYYYKDCWHGDSQDPDPNPHDPDTINDDESILKNQLSYLGYHIGDSTFVTIGDGVKLYIGAGSQIIVDGFLTINKGVQIIFLGVDGYIQVNGGISILGTQEKPVYLNGPPGWGGLRIVEPDTSYTITWAVFTNAEVGILVQDSDVSGHISHTTINGNGNGSIGLQLDNVSNLETYNCLIYGHDEFGLYSESTDVTIQNYTITNNGDTSNPAGGIYLSDGSNLDVPNTILYDNSPQEIFFSATGDTCSAVLTYTDIEDGSDGVEDNNNGTATIDTTNSDVEPLFIDADSAWYSLLWLSDLIDAANPDYNDNDTTWVTDIEDQDPDSSRLDLGALHFWHRPGDVNWDTTYNVLDLTKLADIVIDSLEWADSLVHVQDRPDWWFFDDSDVNDDSSINVLDIMEVSSCVQDEDECDDLSKSKDPSGSANIFVFNDNSIERSNEDYFVISLNSEVPIGGLQFIISPIDSTTEITNLVLAEDASGLRLRYRLEDDGAVFILIYPIDDFLIPAGNHEILYVYTEELNRLDSKLRLSICDIIISDKFGSNVYTQNYQGDINHPNRFALHPAYPNPFNPITTISYDVPKESHVEVIVYDIQGREIENLVNKSMQAGYHSVKWNAEIQSSGVYFVRMTSKDFTKTQKVMLLK